MINVTLSGDRQYVHSLSDGFRYSFGKLFFRNIKEDDELGNTSVEVGISFPLPNPTEEINQQIQEFESRLRAFWNPETKLMISIFGVRNQDDNTKN